MVVTKLAREMWQQAANSMIVKLWEDALPVDHAAQAVSEMPAFGGFWLGKTCKAPVFGRLSGDCVRQRLIRLRNSALYPETAAYCPAVILSSRDACASGCAHVLMQQAVRRHGYQVLSKVIVKVCMPKSTCPRLSCV